MIIRFRIVKNRTDAGEWYEAGELTPQPQCYFFLHEFREWFRTWVFK